MGKIHILAPEVINKIAAGEVIERPASVVKELLENSLDAQTHSVEIDLKQAGKTSIRGRDTGTGIDPDDMEKIFLRHSTSKINSLNDLFNIHSLGFRGEALYSIAAIADITVRSKTSSEDNGWEIHMRADKKISLQPVPITTGTEIEVKELFFNTPARKKFLKSDTTELNHILGVVTPYTLLYPKYAFVLAHNNKKLIDLRPEESRLQRIAQAFNLNKGHLIEATKDFPDLGLSLHLVLGDMNIQRTNKDLQFLFINNRPVQNRALSFHINQMYRLIFPEKVHPFFAIFIQISPEEIDVNVHPTKREVKIKDEQRLALAIRSFCEHMLMTYGKAKQVKEPLLQLPDEDKPFSSATVTTPSSTPGESHFPTPELFSSSPAQQPLRAADTLRKILNEASYVGAFHHKYLLFEAKETLLIVDQHAAHERITFERLRDQIEKGHIEIQQLLTPLLLRITRQEMLSWEETKGQLEKIGFATTLWSNDSLAIHSHPILITQPERAIQNLLSGEELARCDVDTLARRACRQSVMGGDILKKEQAEALRTQLLDCKDPFTCPHGRPTLIQVQESFLNKQFLRA
jgi:DNA mismatch repair protein MutL